MSAYSIPPLIMASITFYVSLYHFIIYQSRRQYRENLTFALMCLCVGLYDILCAGLYSATSVAEGFPWQRAQVVVLAAATVAFVWFINDYIARKPTQWIYVLSALFILSAIGGLVNQPGVYWLIDQPAEKPVGLLFGSSITYYETTPGPLTNVQSLGGVVVFAYALWLSIRLARSEPSKARLLIIAILLLFAGVFNDTAVSSNLYRSIYLFEYTFMGMILLMTSSLSRTVIRAGEAQEALAHERTLLRTLIDNLPDHIYVKDLAGRKTLANRAEMQFTGMDAETGATGKTDQELYPPELAAQYQADDQAVIQTGQPLINREEIVPDAAGRQHWLLTSKLPLRDATGKIVGLVGIGRDITERRGAEAELRASRARLKAIFDNASLGISVVDKEGHFIQVNDRWAEMLGYSPEELVQKRTYDTTYPDDIPVSRERLQALARGEIAHYQLEKRYVRKDGSVFWGNVSVTPIRGEQGELDTIVGFISDITQRKRAEEALQENEARYRSLFEDSPISLWEEDCSAVKQYLDHLQASGVTDLRAHLTQHPEITAHCASLVKILDINQATLRLFQATSKPELYGGLETVFTPEALDVFREELIALAAGKSHFESESIHRTLTSHRMDINLSVSIAPGYQDTWAKVFVSIVDITQRKQAEAEYQRLLIDLAHSSTQLQTAAEVSKFAIMLLDPLVLMQQAVNLIQASFGFYYVGIFLVDETGEYALLRAGTGEAGRRMLAAQHRLAVGSSSMIGWCIAQAQARIALDVGAEAARFDNPLLPSTRSEMALPLMTRGKAIGALTVQSAQAAAFSEEDITALQSMSDQLATAIENARLYEASQQEIARRIRAEEQVRQLNEELEQRVIERTAQLQAVTHELESFAYSVSHDLKAPLRGIDGYSRLLLEDHADRLDEEGRTFLQTIRRATEQMAQLIDDLLAYSRLERRAFTTGTLELRVVVEALLDERADELRSRGISLAADVPSASVSADPAGLAQALRNLLDNALKFTRDVPEPRIELGGRETENTCILWVRDNGIGFDMQYHDRIFDIFQRLHRVEEFSGTGIGLAIVRKAMQRIGGRVWATSAPGEGATFYLEIPK